MDICQLKHRKRNRNSLPAHKGFPASTSCVCVGGGWGRENLGARLDVVYYYLTISFSLVTLSLKTLYPEIQRRGEGMPIKHVHCILYCIVIENVLHRANITYSNFFSLNSSLQQSVTAACYVFHFMLCGNFTR